MNIDIADSPVHQLSALDEIKHLADRRDRRLGKFSQQRKQLASMTQVAAGDFTQNKRMHQYLIVFQCGNETWITASKMVDPYRGIDEDHTDGRRRRRGTFNCG